ncbi:MAG: hypothetical protein Q8Q42_03560 [Nanoarchaeota archaeon]|nr:hypothetical protein [Nanoarchaeota archaeon]
MIGTLISPKWFYGKDILIDFISFFVLILVGVFTFKYYKIRKGRNYLFLSLSFLSIAVSFLIKIILNIFSYYIEDSVMAGILSSSLTGHSTGNITTIFAFGLFAHRLLLLNGFYLLYIIYQKCSTINFDLKLRFVLMIYLLTLVTIFTHNIPQVFYLTSMLILVLVTALYWRQCCQKNKKARKNILFYSFSVITLSQALFIFANLNPYAYVSGEIIQLIGYVLLLITFINVLFEHGKKKNKN